MLQVNLNTVWILARDVGRHMLATRGGISGEEKPAQFNPLGNGKIINIASLVSYQGQFRATPNRSPSCSANQLASSDRRIDCSCVCCCQARCPRRREWCPSPSESASALTCHCSKTRALSNEWASKGVNVNAISPGYIATDVSSPGLHLAARS